MEPNEFICPITLSVMEDPVIAEDGHSYERAAITKWLKQSNKSPLTGNQISHKLIPNVALKNLIQDWGKLHHDVSQVKINNNDEVLVEEMMHINRQPEIAQLYNYQLPQNTFVSPSFGVMQGYQQIHCYGDIDRIFPPDI